MKYDPESIPTLSVLEHLKRRPDATLTHKSVIALENFLNGYFNNMLPATCQYGSIELNVEQFKFWVVGKPHIPGARGPRISDFLISKCHGDDEAALDLFFELLDRFVAEKKLMGTQ